MKVLSISTDRKIFEEGSAVRARTLEYGGLVEELHIIVFAKRSLGLHNEKIAPNIFAYPTNSLGRFSHILAAISCARALKLAGAFFDLVTTQDPFETGFAGLRIARRFNARLHIQIHTDVMSKYFLRGSIFNPFRVFLATLVIPHADAVRVVSTRIKNSIEKLVTSDTPINVLPIFVNKPIDKEIVPEKDLRKKYPQFDFRALIVARLVPEKNIQSAIIAMDQIRVKHPKAALIIVGDGPEKHQLEMLADRLGLDQEVIFEGWQDSLYSYYKTADVLVLPSLYEGYGMVAVEAAQAGCPVVMTNVGCAGDIIKDAQNGLIVPVDDTNALAQAIERIASGEVKFEPQMPLVMTKEEYLQEYAKSWENALN